MPRADANLLRPSGAAGVRGAGGDDSWGALPLEPYRYTLHRGDSFTLTLWVE